MPDSMPKKPLLAHQRRRRRADRTCPLYDVRVLGVPGGEIQGEVASDDMGGGVRGEGAIRDANEATSGVPKGEAANQRLAAAVGEKRPIRMGVGDRGESTVHGIPCPCNIPWELRGQRFTEGDVGRAIYGYKDAPSCRLSVRCKVCGGLWVYDEGRHDGTSTDQWGEGRPHVAGIPARTDEPAVATGTVDGADVAADAGDGGREA